MLALMEVQAWSGNKDGHNRFVVFARRDIDQAYLQCLFRTGEGLVCEASSGDYGPPIGVPGVWHADKAADTRFRQDDFVHPGGMANYQRRFDTASNEVIDEATKVLLGLMFDVYGARHGTPMRLSGPKVPAGAQHMTACTPLA